MKNNFALCIDQKKFRLKNVLALSKDFNYKVQNFSSQNCLDTAVDHFIALVKAT
jgi:hypothetical protein